VIKKNWKVIALLVLLLVVALLVLALYPKVQEGLNDKQIKATTTTATVSFDSTDATFSVISNPSITGAELKVSGDKNGCTIIGLKPNTKYTGIKVLDSKKNANAPAYTGSIITLPDQTSMKPPALTKCDLTNVHSQFDKDGKLFAYIKFDAGTDLNFISQGPSTTTSGFNVTNFLVKNKETGNELTSKIDTNPDTGKSGWCKVSNLTPGTKYTLTVAAKCDVPGLAATLLPNCKSFDPPFKELISDTSGEINLFTAPIAVRNIKCEDPVQSTNGNYKVTVTFETDNGPETSYTSSLSCDGSIRDYPGKVENGKGSITIDNINQKLIQEMNKNKQPCFINAVLQCDKKLVKDDGSTECRVKCNMTRPSNYLYKESKIPEGKTAGDNIFIIPPIK
jgi:hypothetical protein